MKLTNEWCDPGWQIKSPQDFYILESYTKILTHTHARAHTYLLRLLSLLLDLLWSRERLHLLSDVLLECLLRERLLLRLSLSRALSFSFSSSSRRLFLSRSSLSRSLSFSLSSRSCFSFFNLSSRSGSSVLFRNFSLRKSSQKEMKITQDKSFNIT